MRLKRFSQNLLLLLATLLGMALVGEAAVRFFTDLSVPLIKRHQNLGTTYRENTTREITGPESNRKVVLRINENGFRTPSRPLAKPSDTARIAVIGDSQIAAINTRAQDTMPVRLENKLNRLYPRVHWEVFNFGVSGANTAQEVNLYRELVRNYDMDVVVCAYYNGNDFSDNSPRLSRNPRIYMDFMDNSDELTTIYPAPSRKKLSNWLNEHSRLYVWQKYVVGDAVNNFLAAGGAGKNQRIRDEFLILVDDRQNETLAYSWRINEQIIRDFNEYVTADNAYFLLLSIPHGIETTPWQWREYQRMAAGTGYEGKIDRRHPEKKLKGFLERHHIEHLFLRSIFEQHLQNTPQHDPNHHLAYRDGLGHLNETGNLVMTDALVDHLEKKGIIAQIIAKNSAPGQEAANDP
ncbi:MAG: hypothetical protein M8357_06780 [Desulfobulbaceae bacterium]|nr:hypothetical protein [Desulfobulbaceae bacterium]